MIKGRPLRIMWKQRDSSMRKSGAGNIFIKNLEASVTSRDMFDTFSQFGNILSCKVACSDGGKSKGFGFVQYQTREEAERAVKSTNGQKLTPTQLLPLIVENCVPHDKRGGAKFVSTNNQSAAAAAGAMPQVAHLTKTAGDVGCGSLSQFDTSLNPPVLTVAVRVRRSISSFQFSH